MSGNIPNSDFVPAEFIPGIRAAGQLSDGSDPPRPPAPDTQVPGGDSGIPGSGVILSLASMTGPGESASTTQPAQLSGLNGLMGLDPQELSSTGAGLGSSFTDARRYSWQSKPGRNA
jgi:hypothetical protein